MISLGATVDQCGVVPVALVGDNAAELELNMPIELVRCVGSLVIRIGNDSDVPVELAALARLLASCRNVSYLDIAGRSILGFAAQLPHTLINLRAIFINVHPLHPAEEIASLLNSLPNLERVLLIPDTPTPLPAASLVLQRRLEELTLFGTQISLLWLITSRRWTVRQLTIWFSENSNPHLEGLEWPPEATLGSITCLRIMLPWGAPLTSAARFVTCCSALRRLELNDMAGELVAILPTILNHCQGLFVLYIRFLASVARTEPQIGSICTILVGALPPALRALSLLVRTQAHRAVCDELLPLCRARRVKLAISLS